MPYALSLVLVLFGVWVLLSGHFEPLLLGLGAASSVAIVAFSRRLDRIDRAPQPLRLSWRLFGYWGWLVRQIAAANVDVARRILSPRLPIDPVLERVPASQTTDLGRTLYANSITLTPGTVSTDVAEGTIEVHALTRGALETLRRGEMDARVSALERRP